MATNYQLIADCLWYTGHMMTGVALVVNHYSYPAGIVVVFTGQLITMISRPIGRLHDDNRRASDDTA